MILMNYKTSWKHASITCNNYMQQFHATITSNNYMQQLHASYKQKLLATITCKQLHATVTCNSYKQKFYMQKLHAAVKCHIYKQKLLACPVYLYIKDNYFIFYESKAFGRTSYLFFMGETQVNVHLS